MLDPYRQQLGIWRQDLSLAQGSTLLDFCDMMDALGDANLMTKTYAHVENNSYYRSTARS